MHSQAIDPQTKRVLDKIVSAGISAQFYLAGGTALAIQLGHRKSIDLDFFSRDDFSIEKLKKELSSLGEFVVIDQDQGTLNASLDGVKVSFLRYDYIRLYPYIAFENINLADERDIAAMKIDAASSRGSKKDFIDLYFLLQKYSLAELIGFFEKKIADIKYNKMHIFKSLVYFSDAEDEPMPIMLTDVSWQKVKEKISQETLKL
jgi:predicted nucleotidyltransferase component of viral defense system